jgi:hypothetical protein
VFAKTSRHDTPWVGNLMVIVGGVGLMLLVKTANYFAQFVIPGPDGNPIPLFPNNEFATFIMAATVGSFAVELVYLIVAIVALGMVSKSGGKWWQYAIVLIAIATPILGFYGALKPEPHDSSNYNYVALYWSIGVIVLSAVWFAICRAIRPNAVANAAQHAAEHRGVAPLDEGVDFKALPE